MSLKKATRAVLESKNSGGEELELVDYELEDLPDELCTTRLPLPTPC